LVPVYYLFIGEKWRRRYKKGKNNVIFLTVIDQQNKTKTIYFRRRPAPTGLAPASSLESPLAIPPEANPAMGGVSVQTARELGKGARSGSSAASRNGPSGNAATAASLSSNFLESSR
jgi:hypothetical protein